MEHMRAAVERGHTAASGPFSEVVAELLREEVGASDVLLTTSCTAALEMTALLLDLEADDTVIVPSFGFVTTAARPSHDKALESSSVTSKRVRSASIRSTWRELMDDSVRAVVPIHYAGIAADMDGIRSVLANWPRAELIEDNAHGLFGRYRDASHSEASAGSRR